MKENIKNHARQLKQELTDGHHFKEKWDYTASIKL